MWYPFVNLGKYITKLMILLTGATGFLGRETLKVLKREGLEVRALLRNPATIIDDPLFKNVDIVEGDLSDILSLERSIAGIDEVIHTAAMVSFRKRDREIMHKVNVEGTANLVNVCLENPVHKFVHVSSIAALGRGLDQGLIDESSTWKADGHNSGYAITKYLSEKEVHRGISEGLPGVIAVPGLILGAGDWSHGSAKIFRMVAGGFPFYNTGSNGFVGVEDVAVALHTLLKSEYQQGEKFILVSQNITYQLLLSLIARCLGKKPPGIRVNKSVAQSIGILSEAWAMITGGHPVLTFETARTTSGKYTYDGNLYYRTFGKEYMPIELVIEETAKQYLLYHGNNN